MTATSTPNAAQADKTPGGTLSEVPPGPTVTFYQQVADQFMKDLDATMAAIPALEISHVTKVKFVNGHLNVPEPFLATVTAAVEQTPALQAVKKLDVISGRDRLQYIAAFRPVRDKVAAFLDMIDFTIASKQASLASESLQVYYIAKGLARDEGGADIALHVENMKRDLGRRGRPRLTPAQRKARADAKAAAKLQPHEEVKKTA
jgi:hypothetical protein